MDICQHILALFLLLLAVAQVSFGSSRMEGAGRERGGEGDSSQTMGVESNIGPKSSLEEVNQVLEEIHAKFSKGNTGVKPAEINDHALAVLTQAGFRGCDLLSLVDEAIKENCLAYLKSLYPSTNIIWWGDEDLALLLAKALGRTEWMSKGEWETYCEKEGLDWKLRFRSLIWSKNPHVYEDEQLGRMIFNNELFLKNFKKITQEAYDSNNTAFLKAVPYPSDEFPLKEDDAFFFWSLAFGQEWCSVEWGDYINTISNIDSALGDVAIFKYNNPKVFGHKRVKAFLEDNAIEETLKAAIEWDSLSFAQYIKEKDEEAFKDMVERCSEVHTMMADPFERTGERQLSRVYNLLLKNGRNLERDIASIQFSDVPILDVEHLPRLIEMNFNKVPSSQYDFRLYGSTETGLKFLNMIMTGQFMVGGRTWKEWEEWKDWGGAEKWGDVGKWGELGTWKEAWASALSKITLDTLDTEAFRLINDIFGEDPTLDDDAKVIITRRREDFYRGCMKIAAQKGDVKFIVDNIIPALPPPTQEKDLTFTKVFLDGIDSPVHEFLIEAAEGNFVALDWIFHFDFKLLEKFEWDVRIINSYSSPLYVPFLSFLFKKLQEKGLPIYKCLVLYATNHLSEAIKHGNFDHYTEVRNIKGFAEAVEGYEFKIPDFP